MSIARTVEGACRKQHCAYEVWSHEHTSDSIATAMHAHIPPQQLAKAVALRDEQGPVLAVIPADRHIDGALMNELFHRCLYLMSEDELATVFPDCEVGAVPATGQAYNLRTIADSSLLGEKDIWFEGGDHVSLIHMTGEAFRRLMQNAETGTFSYKDNPKP